MFDPNSTVCTSVHSVTLDMYAPQEVEAFSVCKITETQIYHSRDKVPFAGPALTASAALAVAGVASSSPGGSPAPVIGGLHDRRLGSVDGREPCATCGCTSDCPGHPGHLQLALPTFQPALLPSLVKILKFTCLYCGRLRVPPTCSSLLIKAFELLQLGRFEELQRVTDIALSSLRVGPASRNSVSEYDYYLLFTPGQRAALCRAFRVLDNVEDNPDEKSSSGQLKNNSNIDERNPSERTEICVKQEEPAKPTCSDAHYASVDDDTFNHPTFLHTRRRGVTVSSEARLSQKGGGPEKYHSNEDQNFLKKLHVTKRDIERLSQFSENLSESEWQVSSWRRLRRLIWTRAVSRTVCPNCGRSCTATFHEAPKSVAVEMRWKWSGKPPIDGTSVFFSGFNTPDSRQATGSGPGGASAAGDVKDDVKRFFNERCLTYGTGGQAIGKMQLYAFQLRPLVERLFSHRLDRLLLQCLLPISTRLAASCFFISTLPIPANNFRPPASAAAFGRGGGRRGMPVLHPRTATLLDLVTLNERVLLAVNVIKHPDPIGALEDPSRLVELFSGQPVSSAAGTGSKQQFLPPVLTVQEQQRLKEFVMVHAAGNATWLPAYSAQLQRKVNQIADQTKAENAYVSIHLMLPCLLSATASPGIRQWLEKKEGAIRQKMMGKRVNFAARTVVAPDALIATNEIGVPLEFAMKLYLPEPGTGTACVCPEEKLRRRSTNTLVTPRNAHLLAAMVVNGPFQHPGAVLIRDAANNVFVLEYLSPAARRAKARQILAAVHPGSARGFSAGSRVEGDGTESSFTVYRHVLDGDVVLMNRQPSLHRLSLMGHFVRILRGACDFYHINDYLLRHGLQQKLLETHLERQSGGGSRALKKRKKTEDERKRLHRETTGRVSLVHYCKRFASQEEVAESASAQTAKVVTRKDVEPVEDFYKEDVFRLNFVNCSSYNADFDGDEMNLHLPQDIMARTEAAYVLNADCHFLVPKDGGPMRGLIQDFCLAGCMLTARDTFLTADMFHTLVYSGLSCYIDSGENTVILDRACGQGRTPMGSNTFIGNARSESAFAGGGDPYRRHLLAGGTSSQPGGKGEIPKLVIVPPAIIWPQRLWTGKQVISCILKTLVDGIATKRLARTQPSKHKNREGEEKVPSCGTDDCDLGSSLLPSNCAAYRGINLTGKAKTPGDAWGGADDGDTEEECVIIQYDYLPSTFGLLKRESELLQGVFDKAQFGSNAGGLLHCVFLLLGSAAAGLLLQSLAALFCAYLKLSNCLVERVVQAGTYLQEHFTARLNNLMGWTDEEESRGCMGRNTEKKGCRGTRTAACQSDLSAEGEAQFQRQDCTVFDNSSVSGRWRKKMDREMLQSKCEALLQMVSNSADLSVEEFKKSMVVKEASSPKGVPMPAMQLERLRLTRLADAVSILLRISGQHEDCVPDTKNSMKEFSSEPDDSIDKTELPFFKENEKKNFLGHLTCEKSQAAAIYLNPWMLARLQRLPLMAAGKLITASRAFTQIHSYISMLKTMSPDTTQALLTRLQETSPTLITQQLPRLARLLHGHSTARRHVEPHAVAPPCKSKDLPGGSTQGHRGKLPVPSTVVCLPNGGYIQGDPSLLRTRLFHPSWLWRDGANAAGNFTARAHQFEKTDRYILQAAARTSMAYGNIGMGLFSIPSKLTQIACMMHYGVQRRIGSLYRNHFLGRKEMFHEMFDVFFQSSIGKIASSCTDILDGSSFLYPFPQNGFAGMIKSGSKGSNINFAMISVFLGQQSLEGRRVKSMPSDRSLPSFCPYDFGSRARGFITSSFLSGLKEEEYFFHCMAGREGLVDTAVKTAKSGYLQRSVIKGMEALTVRYDGSVRDADDSVIQFVYGDDGRDPMHRSTFEKITCLLENPELLHCVSPVSIDMVARSVTEKKEVLQTKTEDVNGNEFEGIECPLSPFSRIGVTCPKFEDEALTLVNKVLEERQRIRNLQLSRSTLHEPSRKIPVKAAKHRHSHKHRMPFIPNSTHSLERDAAEEDSIRVELYNLLQILYHRCLVPPGEGVGCVAAQSIGEPATQMTLNTFHLAGHGAANVTLGIPRLRELLQQGGATKTPVVYVPLRSSANLVDGDPRALAGDLSNSAVLAQNAATALRGFTTINLAACVHSVGVETKVCYQSPHCLEGCPAFHLPPYTKSRAAASWTAPPCSRLYWQYDICIQLENLSHFVQVVRTYNQADICAAVLKKVIRTFLKKVSRLMVATVAHYGRTGFSAARNEMQTFFQQRICQENRLNRWHYRSRVKEILRSARVATDTADVGEATSADSFFGGPTSGTELERKEGAEDDQEGQQRHAGDDDLELSDERERPHGKKKSAADGEDEEQESSQADEDEDTPADDKARESEDEEAVGEEELWDNSQKKKKGRRIKCERIRNHRSPRGGVAAAEDAKMESFYTASESESRHTADSSGSSGLEEEMGQDRVMPWKIAGPSETNVSRTNSSSLETSSFLLVSFAELLRGKEFNLHTHLFETPIETDGKGVPPAYIDPSLQQDALWENGRRHRGAVLISREVASILHGISVCPRTWRMDVKFGWPMEKCPYRLEVLPLLKNLLQKSYLQRPEGVTAPRIAQGEGCASGQESELQCEGSNLQWIHQMKEEAIDQDAIRTNDVRAVLKYYGVEAARVCLVRELEQVFSAYGINVDYRHLALIADFMTHSGGIRPFNRSGIAASNAPFQQMSYETSFKFLTEACERAATDSLTTPSGALMAGTPATVGAGHCEVYTQVGSVAGCCV